MELIVDIPVPGGGRHDFHPMLGPQLFRQFLLESIFNDFFALFPKLKKVRGCPGARALGRRRLRAHSSAGGLLHRRCWACGCAWTPAAGSCSGQTLSRTSRSEGSVPSAMALTAVWWSWGATWSLAGSSCYVEVGVVRASARSFWSTFLPSGSGLKS